MNKAKSFALSVVPATLLYMTQAMALDPENAATVELNQDFLEAQVQQNMSVGRAVKSIISHYPEQATQVVGTAFDLYPKKYKEIIHAAISAQPSLTEDVVQLSLDRGVSNCTSIVETAITAAPSYVDFVVHVAANATPEELEDIVRVAVVTEPDSADRIVQTLAKSYPEKIKDIVRISVGAVPFVGEYIVDALLAVFPGKAEEVVTTALEESNSQRDYAQKIMASAMSAGVNDKQLQDYVAKSGSNSDDLKEVLEQ